jgi:hypothetical protein
VQVRESGLPATGHNSLITPCSIDRGDIPSPGVEDFLLAKPCNPCHPFTGHLSFQEIQASRGSIAPVRKLTLTLTLLELKTETPPNNCFEVGVRKSL